MGEDAIDFLMGLAFAALCLVSMFVLAKICETYKDCKKRKKLKQ